MANGLRAMLGDYRVKRHAEETAEEKGVKV